MDLTLTGTLTAPALAMLGTWEPYLAAHDRVLAELCDQARSRELAPVAIMLDPPPALFLNGEAKWPLFSDAATRVAWLHRTGVAAVATVHFTAADLGLGAAEFFDVVCSGVPLSEFWLREGQSIGSGQKGNGLNVVVQTHRRTIRLRRLPADEAPLMSSRARSALAAGAPGAASRFAGRPPTFSRPASGHCRIAWPAGLYRARASVSHGGEAASTDRNIEIELVSDGTGVADFRWPDPRMDSLAFEMGPGDLANLAESSRAAEIGMAPYAPGHPVSLGAPSST